MVFDFSEAQQKFDKAIEHIATDVSSLRTGRASVQMLDGISVEAYGSYMKLTEVASVSAPDPTLLVVSPWDKGLLAAIERAIATSDLNLNPVIDKEIVRIAIAPLTEERRKEMVKRLHQKIESGKVMIRNLRTDVKKEIEDQEDSGGVSEDEVKRDLDELEKTVHSYTEKIETMAKNKEKELLTI